MNSERKIVDCLLADQTGPIIISFWDDAAMQFLSIMQQAPPVDPNSPALPIVLLENMKVTKMPSNTWNGKVLTKINQLQSIASFQNRPGTRIRLANPVSSQFMISELFSVPVMPVCVSKFRELIGALKAPFRMSVRGVVMDVQDLDATLSSRAKRLFSLVDESGHWIQCCGIDRNAHSKALVEGMEVVFFFATGRPQLGGTGGILYAMKDSLIVPIQPRGTRQKHTEIEITD